MQGGLTTNSIAIWRKGNVADGVSTPKNGVRWFFNTLLGGWRSFVAGKSVQFDRMNRTD
jgi:hypothetical protein